MTTKTARGAKLACASVGYQGKSIDAFCALLVSANIRTLVDVRARAWSQRPVYRKGALTAALAKHGIDYVHCRNAGNPFRPKPGEKIDFAACEALYSKHLDEHPEVIDELEPLVSNGNVALFCYEAERSCCHRGVLLRALKQRHRGLVVTDL